MWTAQYRAASLTGHKRVREDEPSHVGLASLPHELLNKIQERVQMPTDSTEDKGRLMYASKDMHDVRGMKQTGCIRRHTSIPVSVWQEDTDLSGCLQTPEVLDTLMNNTLTLTHVKTLSVANNKLRSIFDLSKFPRLTSLELSGNKLDAEAANELGTTLVGNAVLTTLDLSNNQLCGLDRFGDGTYNPSGIQAIASALAVNAVLNKLVLSFNSIYDEGAIALGEALKSNKTLKELELVYCDIGAEGGKALASALSEGSAVLNKIVLDGNKIKDEGAIALGEALKSNKTLKELALSSCGIGAEGAKALASALSEGSAVLKNVDVSYNYIQGEGAQQLAAAALGSASLEVLSKVPIKEIREDKHTELQLSDRGLGPTECLVLADLLKGSAVLNKIVLSSNSIQDQGAIALGEALKSNKTLKELRLANCNIGAAGGKAIGEALQMGIAVLTTLNLSSNQIGGYWHGSKVVYTPEGPLAIAEGLRFNAVLKRIDLRNNSMGDEAKEALREAVNGREGFDLIGF